MARYAMESPPVPTLAKAAVSLANFPQELTFIRDTLGVNDAAIARSLGVDAASVCRWRQRAIIPSPLVFMAVIEWANLLRQQGSRQQS